MLKKMLSGASVLLGAGLWSGCDQKQPESSGKEVPGHELPDPEQQTPQMRWKERLQVAIAGTGKEQVDEKRRVEAWNKVAGLYAEGLQNGWAHPLDVRSWCDASAEAGSGYSGEAVIGAFFLYGRGINRDPGMALEWFERGLSRPGSQRGNILYMLGMMYSRGDGVARDANKALEYWNKAADSGNPGAMFLLGRSYMTGDMGLDRDVASGIAMLEKAANKGSHEASMHLGRMYARGEGVVQDMARAMKWYEQAASAGNAHAQYIMGMACLEGSGVPLDERKAFNWLQLAAGQEHVNAMLMLSMCYGTGKGTVRDEDMAGVWKQKALMLNKTRKTEHAQEAPSSDDAP